MATELDTALEQLGLSLAVRPEAFEAVRNAAETHENVFMGRGVALRLIAIMDAAKAATKAFTATPVLVGEAEGEDYDLEDAPAPSRVLPTTPTEKLYDYDARIASVLTTLGKYDEKGVAEDLPVRNADKLFGELLADLKSAYSARPAPLSLLGSGDAPADWVIVCRKQGRGLPYWRPNQAGYTESVVDAGKYTYAEAGAICETCKGDAEAYVIGDPFLYTLISNENLARGKEIKLWLENRDLRAARPAPLSLLGSGDAADTEQLAKLIADLREECTSGPLTRAGLVQLLPESVLALIQAFHAERKERKRAESQVALSAAASTGGGAVPDELLSAYCDLAASHDDALPISATVYADGLVELCHNDGTPIEAGQRLADFVAAACNAAGAGFRKDLAAFGREDAAPQHLVVGEAAPQPWCARCPATEKDVNSPGFQCAECDSLLGISHEAR